MYHPWEPEKLGEIYYDLDGNPVPLYTLDDFALMSSRWVEDVIRERANAALDEIAYMTSRAKLAVERKAQRVGMLMALSIAVATAPDHAGPI